MVRKRVISVQIAHRKEKRTSITKETSLIIPFAAIGFGTGGDQMLSSHTEFDRSNALVSFPELGKGYEIGRGIVETGRGRREIFVVRELSTTATTCADEFSCLNAIAWFGTIFLLPFPLFRTEKHRATFALRLAKANHQCGIEIDGSDIYVVDAKVTISLSRVCVCVDVRMAKQNR